MYYKVTNENMESARAEHRSVTYLLNEWVYAPKTKDNKPTRLFVFENLEDAQDFASCTERIFECEVKQSIKGRGAYAVYDMDKLWAYIDDLRKEGKKLNFDKIEDIITLTYIEAILARAVKLTRELPNGKCKVSVQR